MNAPFFVKGLLVGVSIAAPVGPIGILCIRRSVKTGMAGGFAAGMGAATADAAYGCVAAFGLTAVSAFITGHRFWIGTLGGAFLCLLGARTFLAGPPKPTEDQDRPHNLFGAWASTFLLTLGNPATVVSFAAVFAAFGLGGTSDYLSACSLVLGVFLGSAAWWLALSAGVSRLRSRLNPERMVLINRISGAVLVILGVGSLNLR